MAKARISTWLVHARSPSFWALVALLFVAILLGWVYQLNRDTQEIARENRQAVQQIASQGRILKAAVEHQCQTDAAHDIAVREYIRVTKDLDALAALVALHLLLVDVTTCREVTG